MRTLELKTAGTEHRKSLITDIGFRITMLCKHMDGVSVYIGLDFWLCRAVAYCTLPSLSTLGQTNHSGRSFFLRSFYGNSRLSSFPMSSFLGFFHNFAFRIFLPLIQLL